MRALLIASLFLVGSASAQDVRLSQASSTALPQVTLDQVYTVLRSASLNNLSASDQQALSLSNVSPGAYGNVSATVQDGEHNTLLVEQIGARNSALLVQRGQANEASVFQNGQENEILAIYTGDRNNQQIIQNGDGNRYLLDFEGNSLQHTVEQIGNGNVAVQVGVGNQPADIAQTGNNMEVRVERRYVGF